MHGPSPRLNRPTPGGSLLAAALRAPAGRLAAAAISGALLYASSRLDPWWWAAWLAPVPLLLAAFHASAREARWLASGVALAGAAATATYYATVTGPLGAALIAALQALAWRFVVARTRSAVLSSRHWLVALLYPTLWTAIDTLVVALSPHGVAGTLVFSQAGALPVIQIAAWTGGAGVVFTYNLVASLAAVACYRGGDIERPWLAYGLPSAIVLAVLGFGASRLAAAAPMASQASLPIGLVAIDETPASGIASGARAAEVWAAYGQAVAGMARRGARIVVLPEKIASVAPGAAAARLQSQLQRIARASSVYLLAGIDLDASGHRENRAWLLSPAGELLADYSKRHPVPGLEAAYLPGASDAVRTFAGHRFGIAICKDMDFPSLGRRYGRLGIAAMLQPAWDFYRDRWLRARAAALWGVENGFTVVHASRDGVLSVSDRFGRFAGATPSDSAPVATLLVEAPLAPGAPTPYALLGDWFGWLCVAACAAALIPLRRSQAGRGQTPPAAVATEPGEVSARRWPARR